MLGFEEIVQRRQIEGFPGYWIYEDGRVWSDPKGCGPNICGKFLRVRLDSKGYARYCLYKNRQKHDRFVHHLVLEAFIGLCPEGMECRHLDGNPPNNHLSNLKWGTKKENCADKRLHGTSNWGEKCGTSKLTNNDVCEIRDLLYSGLFSQREIGNFYGVTRAQISHISTGKCWNFGVGI